MNRILITTFAAGALATSGLAVGQAGHGHWRRGNPLDNMAGTLNLTPDQQAKIQPILDQAKPQLVAVHREAMQKAKAVIDNTMTQIRPLLTPDQQKKADDLRQAREEVKNAVKHLHDVKGQ
jgi:Spy/CpxP family protein refolding chaperone